MTMDRRINPIENGLLQDLLPLYREDLEEERHTQGHKLCPVCSKQAIIFAIAHYLELDSLTRDDCQQPDISLPMAAPISI